MNYLEENEKASGSWDSVRESYSRRLQDLHRREKDLNERESAVEYLADTLERTRMEVQGVVKQIEKRKMEVHDREEELVLKIESYNEKIKGIEEIMLHQQRQLKARAGKLNAKEKEIDSKFAQLQGMKEKIYCEKKKLVARERMEMKLNVNKEAERIMRIKDESRLTADENKVIGRAHFDKKRYEKAIHSYQLSASIDSRKYGKNHAILIDTFNMIGRSSFKAGFYDKALEAFGEKLCLQKRLNGENHMSVADTLCFFLGRTYAEMSSFGKAADSYRRAGQIYSINGEHEKAKQALELVANATAMNMPSISGQYDECRNDDANNRTEEEPHEMNQTNHSVSTSSTENLCDVLTPYHSESTESMATQTVVERPRGRTVSNDQFNSIRHHENRENAMASRDDENEDKVFEEAFEQAISSEQY
eukprot:CAMPEP_0113302340 /NCGR_PEP_ID=MMETSP0010_2-20120614/3188_1 /TAXON_ID=216773 ORGANISM="Corethron hystrix, Strain 308" /NCGR_SAMPLE_ID=MMETSP0010_2 /ASSEMBLY_ACC=CAM_ASM_000155 /LENGTH=419 /DNA_ID=CAMNT_0000156103 /DNA_START=3 /DNA_END=1262 /DNA_ORIENTATION=+ /assembly_acc=CAM_ASM_000155